MQVIYVPQDTQREQLCSSHDQRNAIQDGHSQARYHAFADSLWAKGQPNPC